MMQGRIVCGVVLLASALQGAVAADRHGSQAQERDWGAPSVTVRHEAGAWTIAGRRNTVVLTEADLSISIRASGTGWRTAPSSPGDLLVRTNGRDRRLRLADARGIQIEPYRTGYAAGVKIAIGNFRPAPPSAASDTTDLRLFLSLALDGDEEDLVFDVSAAEGATMVRELNWPPAMDGRAIDATVLSHDDGVLLPRDWPTPYFPIHRAKDDTSIIQSNLIESWAMSWWGFQQGPSALIVIVETPDDAAYTFSHPAGGPTSIGPSWRPQLGRFGYMRRLRMAFLPKGNYVDLAKRYRRYVMDTGLFVSLNEKIARNPLVERLIGTPIAGARVLRNVNPESPRYDKAQAERNHQVTPFAEQAERLRRLKAGGFDRLNVSLSGWPALGYDRQHPDGFPPTEDGGGWAGMKTFFDVCEELGYLCWLHDQYRDYYPDSPSFNKDLAVREEDVATPSTQFPGTRFHPHDWKDGAIPMMNYWDGGPQAYLNNRYMLGHVQKNYRLMAKHGIRPRGSYNDVFGYVPPDQDFNPEHPSTRTDSMRDRALVMTWVRRHLGISGTEDGADWTIPYVDYVTSRLNRNPGSGNDETSKGAIEVPLYELVYHDAVVTSYSPDDPRGFLHGNVPSMGTEPRDLENIRRMAALHQRVGLLELTQHEFLDTARAKERTTFADGTTVTVDWTTRSVTIRPDVHDKASTSQPDTESRAAWLAQAAFGVMTHYLADWRAKTDGVSMSVENWNDLIDRFDVEGLAAQLSSAGASYHILTIGQNSGYYASPNATYDRLVGIQPSKLSRRDLIADMAAALARRGIRLIVYLPAGAPNSDRTARDALQWQNGAHPNLEFQRKWEQVIREWSLRWGTKVSGWWFDGCYWPNTMYRRREAPNFESFAAAARAGNPAAAIAFNPGVVRRLVSIAPVEDYTAGEQSDPARVEIRRAQNGIVDGAQAHILSYLGTTWGMGEPRFSTAAVVEFTNTLKKAGAAVTWDVPVQSNGLIAQPFLTQLASIGRPAADVRRRIRPDPARR
jgi:hypothetical protein